MRLIIENDRKKAGAFTCRYVVEKITAFCEESKLLRSSAPGMKQPLFGLCLSGYGKLMNSLLDELVRAHHAGDLSFRNVAVFVTDEFVCSDRFHPATQHAYIWHRLFKHVDILRENVHVLDGSNHDLTAECAAYERAIELAGGLQLVVAESGRSGEIGRNAPGSSLTSRTREKLINYDASVDIADELFDGCIEHVPKSCLTIGIRTIMEAREVVVLFTGVQKSHALESCIEDAVNHMFPVSVLQEHPHCLVVCDEPATSELRVKTVKYFKGLQETAKLTNLKAASHEFHEGSYEPLPPFKRRLITQK